MHWLNGLLLLRAAALLMRWCDQRMRRTRASHTRTHTLTARANCAVEKRATHDVLRCVCGGGAMVMTTTTTALTRVISNSGSSSRLQQHIPSLKTLWPGCAELEMEYGQAVGASSLVLLLLLQLLWLLLFCGAAPGGENLSNARAPEQQQPQQRSSHVCVGFAVLVHKWCGAVRLTLAGVLEMRQTSHQSTL